MAETALRALTIARPLQQSLRARPFSGYVAGRFARACNLADDAGRVIALTIPAIGNGPFFIVLDVASDLFETLESWQPVWIDVEQAVIGPWRISLSAARIWDATLPESERALCLTPALATIVRPYSAWPQLASDTPTARSTARMLAQGAHAFMRAVQLRAGLVEAAQSLAGLGGGLTPAGDDFVLGAIAALWLLGEREALPAIAQASAARTTALSGAFLAAAAQGQFIEPWHDLALALRRRNEADSRAALRRVATFGASSGRDALAGFATTLLRHAHHS